MRILFSSMVAATIAVAGSAVGWKAEAAMTRIGTLPLQTKSYTPVETVGYYRGYYGYGYPYHGYGYYRPHYGGYGHYRPYGYHRPYGYGWRPGISWGWGY